MRLTRVLVVTPERTHGFTIHYTQCRPERAACYHRVPGAAHATVYSLEHGCIGQETRRRVANCSLTAIDKWSLLALDHLSRRPPRSPRRSRLASGRLQVLTGLRGSQSHRSVRIAAALIVVAIAAAAAGCTFGRSDGGSGPESSVQLDANTLRYPLNSEPTTLDPATVEDGTTIDLLQNIYEGLVRWNTDNRVAPNLAQSWDVSRDGKTYTFHLMHGVKFQNGREMTADDFKYSLERACDPATKSATASDYLKDVVGVPAKLAGKASDIPGVKVIDPYTLQITIDAYKPYWIDNLTYPTGYVVCKEAIAKTGGLVTADSAIGTGPFKLAQIRRGYEVILAANADYHEGRPRLDFIERPILKDGNTRLNKYAAGELDYLVISPQDLDRVDSDSTLKADLHTYPRAEIWYVALNSAAPGSPFGSKAVRQAFAMAIDKKEVIRIALKDTDDLANGIVPPQVPDISHDIKPLPYDPARAQALLAQAGYPGGKGFPTLPFSYRQDQPEVGQTAEVIAEQIHKNLGVSLQLRPIEWAQFLKERLAKTMPISHLRWAADYLDPQDFLSLMLHTSHLVNGQEDHPENGVGYSNPTFDRLCDTADVEHDTTKRMAMYHQAEQIAVDDAPWVPIYFKKELELDKPRVHGIRDSVFGHLPHTTTAVH